MSIINKIKNILAEKRLQRLAKNAARKKEFVNLGQARSIAVIFEATNIDHLELVKRFVNTQKEKKKTVKAVGFFDQKFTPSNISYSKAEFDFFNLKELSGTNQPASPYIKTFIEEQHDVFIDLNIHNKFPLRSIAIQSAAKCKVGIDIPENQDVHDLFISVKPEEGLVRFLGQVEHYLEMINKKE
jgi:hypothetical protein